MAGLLLVVLLGFGLLSLFAVARRSLRHQPAFAASRGTRPAVHASRSEEVPGSAAETMAETARRQLRVRARLMRRRLRERNFLRDNLLFLSRFVSAPKQVGSIAPSSRSLGRAMAAELPSRFDICVELGGGTGSLTRVMLAAGVPRDRLIVVERDPRLGAHLRNRFPGVKVVVGDAQELTTLLQHQGIERVDAVISSLPLRSLPRTVGDRILAESFRVLAEGGAYVQFTYGLIPPVPAATADTLGIEGESRAKVWNNLPPATVWRYRRKGSA